MPACKVYIKQKFSAKFSASLAQSVEREAVMRLYSQPQGHEIETHMKRFFLPKFSRFFFVGGLGLVVALFL